MSVASLVLRDAAQSVPLISNPAQLLKGFDQRFQLQAGSPGSSQESPAGRSGDLPLTLGQEYSAILGSCLGLTKED